METVPVVLFVYNRLDVLERTVEALKKNELAPASSLFIFSDGPKNDADFEKVKKVRDFLRTISGFREVVIRESETNQGLATSVIRGVTDMLDRFNSVIVLEDDLVTSPGFLRYMNEALSWYENEDRVMSISGYSYSFPGNRRDTFFLPGTECWGWATWKRAWKNATFDAEKLYEKILTHPRYFEWIRPKGFPLFDLLRAAKNHKVSSWAVCWDYSVLLQNGMTLFPKISLVEHIGLNGTHCGKTVYSEPCGTQRIRIETIPLECDRSLLQQTVAKYGRLYPETWNKKMKRVLSGLRDLLRIHAEIKCFFRVFFSFFR